MRRIVLSIFCVYMVSVAFAFAAPPQKATSYSLTGWRSVEMVTGTITASGGAPLLTSGDGKLRLSARKIVIRSSGAKDKQTVTSVEAMGSVSLESREGPKQDIRATCARAIIRIAENVAVLSDGVKVSGHDGERAFSASSDVVKLHLKSQRVELSAPDKGSLKIGPR